MDAEALSDIRRKMKILNHAEQSGNISHTCRYYGMSRETLYRWKRLYKANGKAIRVPQPIEEKILYLHRTYHLGQQRISWYLARYHNLHVSPGGVRGVLLRHGLNRLLKNDKNTSCLHLSAMRNKCPAIGFKWTLNFYCSKINKVKN